MLKKFLNFGTECLYEPWVICVTISKLFPLELGIYVNMLTNIFFYNLKIL